MRWFQFGAFCPLFRLHGYRMPQVSLGFTGGPNEVWSFGDAYSTRLLRRCLRPMAVHTIVHNDMSGRERLLTVLPSVPIMMGQLAYRI